MKQQVSKPGMKNKKVASALRKASKNTLLTKKLQGVLNGRPKKRKKNLKVLEGDYIQMKILKILSVLSLLHHRMRENGCKS